MKVVFYHNSGTGCGIYAINQIKKELEKYYQDIKFEIYDINKIMHDVNAGKEVSFADGDLYFISTFSDVMKISPAVEHFLKLKTVNLTCKRVATFDTNGGAPGICPQEFNTIVTKKKGIHLGHLSIRFLSNNYHKEKNGLIVPISPVLYKDIAEFIKTIHNKQDAVKFGIASHTREKMHLCIATLVGKTGKSALKLKVLIGGKLRVDADKCIGCTICEQHCPAFCYDMVNKKAVLARPN